MKRFFVLATMLGMILPFSLGCEKKPAATPAAPADAPAAAPADAPAEPAK